MSKMEEDLEFIAKLNESKKIAVNNKILTVEKVEDEYNPVYEDRIKDTVLLFEKLDEVLNIKGFNEYDFTKEEYQLNFMMLNGTIIDLFTFYGVPPVDVKNSADWENHIYKILGKEYMVNNFLYTLNQKEFTKEIKAILNLNRADFLSKEDGGKKAKDQRDFNKLIKEIEKIIKKNINLGLIGILQLCKQIITFYQEKYGLEETFNLYERYIIVKGFKIFKTYSKYQDKCNRHIKIHISELLSAQKFLNSYKAGSYYERQFFYMFLSDDLEKYEVHVRTTLKNKEVSKNIEKQNYYFYLYSFLAIYYAKNTDEKPAKKESMPWYGLNFNGEKEGILRKAMEDAEVILLNKQEVDWNPLKIAKLIGIDKASKRAQNYRLFLLFSAVYKEKVSRATFWRHSQRVVNNKEVKTRDEYLEDVKVSQEIIQNVAKLKKQKESSQEIAKKIGVESRTVDNYWAKYRK